MYKSSKFADEEGRKVCDLLNEKVGGEWSVDLLNRNGLWDFQCRRGMVLIFRQGKKFGCIIEKEKGKKSGWSFRNCYNEDPRILLKESYREMKKHVHKMIKIQNREFDGLDLFD